MATQRPQKSLAEREDAILRKIFLVSLMDYSDTDPKTIYLELTAAEFLSQDKPLMVSVSSLERIIVDRLSGDFPGSEAPFPYLLGCYKRASDESKKITSVKDQTLRRELESVVRQAKKLAVSYSRLHLNNPGTFPDNEKSPVSPLLPLLLSDVSSSVDRYGATTNAQICPPGFLDDFFRDSDFNSLEEVYKKLYMDITGSVKRVSALGNFQQPLKALMKLANFPSGAKALVSNPNWIPKGNGREIEMSSILGSFFHVSALPDHMLFKAEPDVGEQCFSEVSTGPANFATIRVVMNNLYDGLGDLVLSLLKNIETRERVLEYIAEMINRNSARGHIQVDTVTCASSGTFVNLGVVMLRLCEPFLDPNLSKRNRIDPRYVLSSSRLNLRKLTALHASSEEVAEAINQQIVELPTGNSTSFICESFYMTARVLNLGFLKALSELKNIEGDLSRSKDTLRMYKEMQAQVPSPQLSLDISRLEKEIELLTQENLCYDAQLVRDPTVLRRALDFCRLMVFHLADQVGGFKMPLPTSCPMLFACMPEHFVEDVMDLLSIASRVPTALDGFVLDDFMNFLIMFMASPEYIRNPYLRAKMVEVLKNWMPKRSKSSSTASLFEGHQLALDYLVKNLLKTYVDIEFTGSHSQFYDKFNIRHNIAKLLEYLWRVPGHCNAWKQIAKVEKKGVCLNFLNFLINDSIYLLDESLTKISELKEMEIEMGNKTEWERRPDRERQERTSQFHSTENMLRMDMRLAMEDIGMLEFTTEQITAPLLLPEMVERVANMLNYFLLQVAGPKRKSLSLKDPENCEFRPKELLKKIVNIYIHLAQGDKENAFPSAISRDGRSYNDQLFPAAANILRRIGVNETLIQKFVALGEKAKLAGSVAMDVEAALGDIPDEFLDPIQCTIMKDPVILPSSRKVMDRPVIQRILLSDKSDPFNRSHLTEDMLIPDVDLKAQIEEFIGSHSVYAQSCVNNSY